MMPSLVMQVQIRLLTLNPLPHKASCKKCVVCSCGKTPATGVFPQTKNNTNNFPKNPRTYASVTPKIYCRVHQISTICLFAKFLLSDAPCQCASCVSPESLKNTLVGLISSCCNYEKNYFPVYQRISSI